MTTDGTQRLSWPGCHVLHDSGVPLPLDDINLLLHQGAAPGWEKKRSAANSDVLVGERWVFKRINFPAMLSAWRVRWRAGKIVKRNIRVQTAMQHRQMSVPQLVLAVRSAHALVMIYERGLGDTVRDLIEGLIDEQRRARLLSALAAYLAGMHNVGVYHGDLNINNILAQDLGGQWQFTLIDNEQNQILPFSLSSRALANFARMWAHAQAFPISAQEQELLFSSWFSALRTRHSVATLQDRLQRRLHKANKRNQQKRGRL